MAFVAMNLVFECLILRFYLASKLSYINCVRIQYTFSFGTLFIFNCIQFLTVTILAHNQNKSTVQHLLPFAGVLHKLSNYSRTHIPIRH